MCRRCVIYKGRAVGKSTEPDYNESLAKVLAVDRCIALVEVEGEKVAEVVIPKMKMAEALKGKYHDVSMGCFIPGKTLIGDKPMAVITEVGVHDEDGEAVLKAEGVEVQYERAVPVDLTKLTEITECDDEDS